MTPNAEGTKLEWTLKVPAGTYQVCVNPPVNLTFAETNTNKLPGWFCSLASAQAGQLTPVAFHVIAARA
jgi:hypothetical protein